MPSKEDIYHVNLDDLTIEKSEELEYNVTSETKKDKRLRVWIAIFYPESTKENWRQIWEDNFVTAAVSPLHDRDVFSEEDEKENPEHVAGTIKKPHYHVVFRFSGSKSFNQVWDILKLIALDPAHCPPPKIPHGDITTAVQYLIHYNHKEKARYLQSDIISINGFDVSRCFRLNSEQEDILFLEFMRYVETNAIFEYWDLLKKLQYSMNKESLYEDIFRYARSHTILINSLLASRRAMYQKKEKNDAG